MILDVLSLTVAFGMAYHALKAGLHTIQTYTPDEMQTYVLGLYVSFLLVNFAQQSTDSLFTNTWQKEASRIFRFYVLYALVFALFLFLIKSPVVDSRYLFVITMGLGAVLTFVLRMLYKRMMRKAYAGEKAATLIGVVTTRERAARIISDLREDWTRKVAVIYLNDADVSDSDAEIFQVPVKSVANGLVEAVRHDALDEVLFHIPYESLLGMSNDIEEIKSMGATVHLYVPLAESYAGTERSVAMIGECPVVSIAAKTLDPSLLTIKRIFDVLLSAAGLLLSAPIILLVALPLVIESKGPLFFSQTRVGLNGRTFRIFKLRSMYVDAEARKAELLDRNEMSGPMFKMKDDPRITKVGRFIRKTSIDELPQLFNVLRGDMSLVGPRPPLMEEFSEYASRDKRRLSMRPGITGIWQVSGRNEVPDFDEVVRMDLQYIDNWSLMLDVKILMKTIGVVLSLSGR